MADITSTDILYGLISILFGISAAFVLKKPPSIDMEKLEKEAKLHLDIKKEEAQTYLSKIHERIAEYKNSLEAQFLRQKASITNIEKAIRMKEDYLYKKEVKNQEYQQIKLREESYIKSNKAHIQKFNSDLLSRLSEVIDISFTDAKNQLISEAENFVNETRLSALAKNEEAVMDNLQNEAKNVLMSAINRYNTITSVERKSSSVKLSRESAIAQLVGAGAKNIEYFEKLLEVDVVFNDVPSTVTVSGFDLVKRNIATLAIEKLCKEKIVTHALIDKRIEESKRETERIIEKDGKDACQLIGLKNVHPELIRIIGRLKFRTSYGQNILLHSLEVAFIARILAAEIGANVETATIAAFLHDVGKAVDHEIDEAHDKLTKDIMTKYGFPETMIHAAWAHHEAEPLKTPEAHIVKAADALSAGRPGARQESLDKYLERVQQLEKTGLSFPGVRKSFAISAGRELRVIVDPEQISDEKSESIAKEIAQKIQTEMTYPGKIKINVIRYTRATEYAK